MNKQEVIELLRYLEMSYTNFGDVQSKVPYWCQDLQYYSYDDVKNRLDELMQMKEFATNSPTLSRIVGPLTKIKDKVMNSDLIYFCPICKRSFENYDEMQIHQDKCRSVQYIIKQYRRFGLGEVDKKYLYQLSEEEFDIRYKKLLKLVQERTTDEREKKVIGFIFNPPKEEEATKFINEREV